MYSSQENRELGEKKGDRNEKKDRREDSSNRQRLSDSCDSHAASG